MSLAAAYQAFLASPRDTSLNSNASLNYITTLTTINNSAAIAKHLSKQQSVVRKKQEKVLSKIESDNAICLEVETTLEFNTGGGAYLPGLDDNFLSDQVVTFPIIHIVHFDNQRKIQQIRLYWDQGSLLKLVDVIGSRAKHWPIRDGKDQARLITSSVTHTLEALGAIGSTTKQMGDVTITSKQTSPRKKGTGDPHTSLSLFGPRIENQEEAYNDQVIAPRASSKPAARDYHDLFIGNESDVSPASKDRAASPRKENAIAPKGGAGKNYQPSRLFNDEESETTNGRSPQKSMKVNPTKYSHFEFADTYDEEPKQPSKPRQKSKHQSQWDFADFATPEKLPNRSRPQDARHFGFGDEKPDVESPTKNPTVKQPRRDADMHFEFKDDGVPPADRKLGHPRGQEPKNNSGLYRNHLFDDEERDTAAENKIQPPNAVVSLKDRQKDFDPHFKIADSSPGLGENMTSENSRPVAENRMKAVKMMEAQWEATDTSPSTSAQPKTKEPNSPSKKSSTDREITAFGQERVNTSINIAGDGMGGRKGAGLGWSFGDETDDFGTTKKIPENFTAGKENMGFRKDTSNIGIKTGGDGMGGRKGVASTWGFGDESDEFGAGGSKADKFLAGKKQQAPKDSWDF